MKCQSHRAGRWLEVLIEVVGSQEDVGAFPGILLVVALGEVVFEDAQGGLVVVDVVWAGDVVVCIFVGAVPSAYVI